MIKELIQQYKSYILGAAIIGSVLLVITAFVLFSRSGENKNEPVFHEEVTNFTSENSKEDPMANHEEKNLDSEFFVDVKGAVKNPGIYEVQKKMRVWDVIELAGGVKESADTKQINFSQRISDQMVIYIPVNGEVIPEIAKEVSKEHSSVEAIDSEKVDLNKADETELQTLTGIGQKKAREIIRYREENGGFKSIDDLKNISGIGEKTIEKLKEQIIIS